MRFFLFLMVCFVVSTPGHSQSIYLQKKDHEGDNPQSSQEELEELLGKQKPPAPRTIKDYANIYYQSCMGQQHPILDTDDLELLCACTAANFSEVMTPEQVRIMNTNTEEGQYQRNRVLLFVYAPCIEYPTRALVINQCLTNAQVQQSMRNPVKTCSCLADGVAQDLKERAPETIRQALRRNPDNIDPLGLLMNSAAFESRSRYHTKKCIQWYEMGLKKE